MISKIEYATIAIVLAVAIVWGVTSIYLVVKCDRAGGVWISNNCFKFVERVNLFGE